MTLEGCFLPTKEFDQLELHKGSTHDSTHREAITSYVSLGATQIWKILCLSIASALMEYQREITLHIGTGLSLTQKPKDE